MQGMGHNVGRPIPSDTTPPYLLDLLRRAPKSYPTLASAGRTLDEQNHSSRLLPSLSLPPPPVSGEGLIAQAWTHTVPMASSLSVLSSASSSMEGGNHHPFDLNIAKALHTSISSSSRHLSERVGLSLAK